MSAVCCAVEGEGPGETVGGAVQPPCVHPYTCTCVLVGMVGWCAGHLSQYKRVCLSVCLSVCLLLAQFPLHCPSYVYYLCFFLRSRPSPLPGALLYPSLSVLHNGSLVLFGGRTSPAAANDKTYLLRPASATAGVCGRVTSQCAFTFTCQTRGTVPQTAATLAANSTRLTSPGAEPAHSSQHCQLMSHTLAVVLHCCSRSKHILSTYCRCRC